MPDILRIKRRAAGGAAGPPSSLVAAEIAYNEQDNTLYYGSGNSGGLATSILPIGGQGAFATLASPVFTGNPTAPTPTAGDNDTSIATTAFVAAAVSAGTAGVASFNTRTGIVTLSNADVIAVLPASSTTPVMDSTAAVGTGTTWAKADHVHPSDTSRQTAAQVTTALVSGNPGAFSTITATGTITPSQTSGIVGTTTNNNTAAGSVGEYISNQVLSPGAALTSLTALNATSISLTAGDWDVWATVGFAANAATTVSAYWGSISTVSATLNTTPGSGGYMNMAGSFPAGLANQTIPAGQMRISLASTTTVYLVAQALFATNTLAAFGFIGARRVR